MFSKFGRLGLYGVGLLGIVFSVASVLHATLNVQAPEIDSSLVASSLGLVTAGVLILRARLRRK